MGGAPLEAQGIIVEPESTWNIAALLATALLLGGMALYSFGFAPLIFSSLPADTAGSLLRRAFPYYYVFVLITAAVAGVSLLAFDPLSSALMAAAALTAGVARQILMPAINTARDAGTLRSAARAIRRAQHGATHRSPCGAGAVFWIQLRASEHRDRGRLKSGQPRGVFSFNIMLGGRTGPHNAEEGRTADESTDD